MILQLSLCLLVASVSAKQLNFLLIIADDLRDALGCYGDENARTPNIDRFARDSALFTQAFAQQALCAPSRNSLLTSRRPDTLQLYDFYSYWREVAGNFTTLPQHLRNNGYRTKSIGKVFHPSMSSNGTDDCPYSWTDEPFHPYTNRYKDSKFCRSLINKEVFGRNVVCPIKVPQMPNQTLPDLENVRAAKKFLRDRAQDLDPFFLAVGFQKPHIPLKYPKRYLKYHPLKKFDVPKPYNWPENISTVAYNPWNDLRKRDDVKALQLEYPWQKIPVKYAKRIIQSYYAAVTYIDDLVGEVLRELSDSTLLRENTVVLLTSDHGWSLGEHGVWAKYSNFEVAVKVPFILSIPGITFDKPASHVSDETISINATPIPNTDQSKLNTTQRNGTVIDSIIELVDIFPTFAELAGIPIRACQDIGIDIENNVTQKEKCNLCTEGNSLFPLIKAAAESKKMAWKNTAFWQYPRPDVYPTFVPNSDEPRLNEITVMGYSIRTVDYRYTTWLSFSPSTKKPDWFEIIAEELYDIRIDPRELENLAEYEQFSGIKRKLREELQEQYKSALPCG